MKKINETGNLADTDPSLYTGFEVDPKTGKAVEKDEEGDEMSDPERHADGGIPDGNKKPNINVQAEAYKPGFSITAVHEEGNALTIAPGETMTPVETLRIMQRLINSDPKVKLVFEDTTTGQKGDVTPALFVKVYSKMLVAEQAKEAREQDGSEQKPMSESKPNMALANELLNIGLVNNVKKSTEVLREDNPMRKAMEIFYTSKNSNADKDEVKYVPSVIKEGKAVLEKKSAPVVAPKEEAETPKKKRPIIW